MPLPVCAPAPNDPHSDCCQHTLIRLVFELHVSGIVLWSSFHVEVHSPWLLTIWSTSISGLLFLISVYLPMCACSTVFLLLFLVLEIRTLFLPHKQKEWGRCTLGFNKATSFCFPPPSSSARWHASWDSSAPRPMLAFVCPAWSVLTQSQLATSCLP